MQLHVLKIIFALNLWWIYKYPKLGESLIFHFSILTTKMHLIISKLKFLKNVVLSWEVCWKKINLTNCFIKKFVGQSIFIKRKKVQFTFRTKFLDILSTRFQLKEKRTKFQLSSSLDIFFLCCSNIFWLKGWQTFDTYGSR